MFYFMQKATTFDSIVQFAIPILTVGGQITLSFKYPQYALILNLIAQPFWLYSTWKSYKQVGQIGIFVNTVFMTLVIIMGVVNYWFF
jgi:hypothetical protein